jgi:uncharacterized protein (DUF2235 family)
MQRLVVCTDGTWNSKDNAKADGEGLTNVARLAAVIAPRDARGVAQEVYYHAGVGVGPWWEKMVGGAFGVGLSRNVQACYTWLAERWQPGDELWFFGFSRGAYTARSLAGLVRNCGILRPEHTGRAGEAYDLYRDRDDPRKAPEGERARAFRQQYAWTDAVPIKCIGVWDTVGALGVPTSGPLGKLTRDKYGFHDVTLSSRVENAFHALAIDERRKPFAPTLWEVPDADVRALEGRRVEQVWFTGVHSDVGGGYPSSALSDLALAWMMERAARCGLALTADAAACRGACDGALHDSMTAFYRAMGPHVRQVAAQRTDAAGQRLHTFEAVHASAWERRQRGTPPYDPENVRHLWDVLFAAAPVPLPPPQLDPAPTARSATTTRT